MKQICKSKNIIALFNDLNQWTEKETAYYCSLFAPAINLKYNLGIELTIEDLKAIGKKQIAIWKLDSKVWWAWLDWINAIYNFVIENAEKRKRTIPNLIRFEKFDDLVLNDWLERWYAVVIWISVNRNFVRDAIDWKLNMFRDYSQYKWIDLKHFTNIMRWKNRLWDKAEDFNKEFIIDSYAFNKQWKSWNYECDIKEVLEDITMASKYLFY